MRYFILLVGLFFSCPLFGLCAETDGIVFQIGHPDAQTKEFRRWINWEAHIGKKEPVLSFIVGRHRDRDWTPMHISTRDMHNAGHSFSTEIRFPANKDYEKPLYFIIGVSFYHATEPSLIHVNLNGRDIEPVRVPLGGIEPVRHNFDANTETGVFVPIKIEIPARCVRQGNNVLQMKLTDGSWIFFDYLRLSESPEPPQQQPPKNANRSLKSEFRNTGMKDVNEILFVVRKPGLDEHWYANFGYYAASSDLFPFEPHAGSRLQVLNIDSGNVRTVFEDLQGTIRDPQLHYDGEKVLFSYLPAGKRHFNLHEINLDGTGLRQLTFGDWDDVEPTYLASGDIIFCSSRTKRWVQCWLTPVATLHRCGPNGENIFEVSANVEHDNTPWPLWNGQLLYTRWEYVDRSQVDYHHLWTMNPDGTRHASYYGNMTPGTVMIDAKPIADSEKIVASFSPGHGRTEHLGFLTLVDPKLGPDHPEGTFTVGNHADHHDPWGFSETEFMAAKRQQLQLVAFDGHEEVLYELPEELKSSGFWLHEPRPIQKRQRELIVKDQIDLTQKTGRLALIDIYEGRKMQDVKRGSIKELLILETLPEPIHYSGGMDQISSGGTFTLERIFGTVPVEPDGSAYMELPANRSFLFVAMDHEGKAVKRMHSFTNVMPGETTSCVGCHENRTQTPHLVNKSVGALLSQKPVQAKPIENIPDVFDYVRDIQPIWDKHCVSCHNDDRTDGGINLLGDWGPIYTHSYVVLSWRNTFGDNRNRAESNFPPYRIGHQASKLMKLLDEHHEGVHLSENERNYIKYWLEAGAPYAGTYAANGTGQIGWYYRNKLVETDKGWPEVDAMGDVLHRRCNSCHKEERLLPHRLIHNTRRYGRQIVFNFSKPERSTYLRAPLAVDAGGKGRCSEVVFKGTDDPDYQKLLAGIERGRRYILEESNRFSMEKFHANEAYTREMIRYGILPPNHDRTKTPIDPYAIDQLYWKSLWHRPEAFVGKHGK